MPATNAHPAVVQSPSSPRNTARYSNKDGTKVITVPRSASIPDPSTTAAQSPTTVAAGSLSSHSPAPVPVSSSSVAGPNPPHASSAGFESPSSKKARKRQRQRVTGHGPTGSVASMEMSVSADGYPLNPPGSPVFPVSFDPEGTENPNWNDSPRVRYPTPREYPRHGRPIDNVLDTPELPSFDQNSQNNLNKKNKKKKNKNKKKANSIHEDPFCHQGLPYPSGAGVHNYSSNSNRPNNDDFLRGDVWNNKPHEERERIKEFWLSLEEDERKSLVRLEKETVLKKMREQQKTTCTCNICGRKRNAIERELEGLYDSYYQELEQFAQEGNATPFLSDTPPSLAVKRQPMSGVFTRTPGSSSRIVEHVDGEEYEDEDVEDDGEDDDERLDCSEDEEYGEDYSQDVPFPQQKDWQSRVRKWKSGDYNNIEQSQVTDHMLRGDSARFIEMMEKLAERRLRRNPNDPNSDEDAQHYPPPMNCPYPRNSHGHPIHPHLHPHDFDHDHVHNHEHGHDHHHNHSHDHGHAYGHPHHDDHDDHDHDHEVYDDDTEPLDEEGDDDEEYEDGVSPDDLGEPDDMNEDAQRMAEGRRMFQIFAARMFEQRVLSAYKKKLAAERSARLMQELEAEEREKEEREAARASKQQRKREKERLKKQAIAEAKEQKQREKELAEAQLKDRKAEQSKRKAEEKRLIKEAQRKAKEEERLRKEQERQRRVDEQERKNKEAKEKERKAREEKEQLEKEAREAQETIEKEARAKEAQAKEIEAEKERQKQEAFAREAARKQELQVKVATTPVAVPVTPNKPKAATLATTPATGRTPAISDKRPATCATDAKSAGPVSFHDVLPTHGTNPATFASPQVPAVTPMMPVAKMTSHSRVRIPSQQIGDNSSSSAPSGSQASGGPSQNASPLVGSSIHTSPSPLSAAAHNGLASVPPALHNVHHCAAQDLSPSSASTPLKGMIASSIDPFLGRAPAIAPPGMSASSSMSPGFPNVPRPYNRFGSADGMIMSHGLGMPPMKSYPGPPPGLNQAFDAFGGLPTISNGAFGSSNSLGNNPVQSAFHSPSHGRQISGSFEMGTLGINSTPKPAPIGRPGSISASSSQTPQRANHHPSSDDINEHLGSSALLDDAQDDILGPSPTPCQRVGSGAIGAVPPSQAVPGMPRTSFSASPFIDSGSAFPIGYSQWTPTPPASNNTFAPPAGIWNSPAPSSVPFSGMGGHNHSHGPIGSPASHTGVYGGVHGPSLGGLTGRRKSIPPPTLRKTLVNACVKCQEDGKATVVNGYMEYNKVKRQVDLMVGYQVADDEVMVVTETLGNSLNGGGTFDCKEINGLVLIRWEPPIEYVIQKFGRGNPGGFGPGVNGSMREMGPLEGVSVIGQGIGRV